MGAASQNRAKREGELVKEVQPSPRVALAWGRFAAPRELDTAPAGWRFTRGGWQAEEKLCVELEKVMGGILRRGVGVSLRCCPGGKALQASGVFADVVQHLRADALAALLDARQRRLYRARGCAPGYLGAGPDRVLNRPERLASRAASATRRPTRDLLGEVHGAYSGGGGARRAAEGRCGTRGVGRGCTASALPDRPCRTHPRRRRRAHGVQLGP